MISNLLLKDNISLHTIQSMFSILWDNNYKNIYVSSLHDKIIKREETWDIVSQHSQNILNTIIQSCNRYSWIPSDLLLSLNDQKMTPYHMLVDSGDSISLQYLINEYSTIWDNINTNNTSLNNLLYTASWRGYEDIINIITSNSKLCFYDQFNRIPSQVWHLINPIPDSLIKWENQYCTLPINTNNDNDNINIYTEDICSISIVNSNDLTKEQFEKEFLSIRKPVLVRNAVKSWKALDKWSTEYFTNQYGNIDAWIGTIPYALQFGLPGKKGPISHFGRYIDLLKQNNNNNDLFKDKPIMYMFDNEILTGDGKELLKDIEIPHIIEDYYWSSAQFMWGPPSSGAPLHHHKDAWNGLVFGEKKWFFYPPFITTSSTLIQSNWNTEYYCIQKPGDLIYVPDSWSHAIYNTDYTSAIAIEFSYPRI